MHLIWVHVYIITLVHAWRRKRVARWYIFWWGKWANQPIGRVLPFSQGTTGKSDVILHILQKHRLSTIKNAVSEQILLPNQPHTSNRLRIRNPKYPQRIFQSGVKWPQRAPPMVKSFGLITNLLPQQHDDFRQIIATALFLENTKCVKVTIDPFLRGMWPSGNIFIYIDDEPWGKKRKAKIWQNKNFYK